MEKELTRKEILSGKYRYPRNSIVLKPTNHCLQRIKERNIRNAPSVVTISPNNIYSGKTKNKKTIHSIVIRLRHNQNEWLFLCFNPFDCGLKSAWLRNADIH